MNNRILALCLCATALGCGASPADPIPPEPDATGGQSAASSASLPGTGGGLSKATGGQSALGTGSSASNATGGQGTGGNAATGGSAPNATGGQGTGGNAATGGSSATAAPRCGLYAIAPVGEVGKPATSYFCVCDAKLMALDPGFPAGCTPASANYVSPTVWGNCQAYKTNVYPNGQDATPDGVSGQTARITGFDTLDSCQLEQSRKQAQS